MTIDEHQSRDSDHGVELHNAHSVEIVEEAHQRSRTRRRTFATLAVATCLGMAGVIIGIAMVRGQEEGDTRATREALDREELRDGWKTLAAAATEGAQRTDTQATAASSVAPPASAQPTQPTTNVVVVNVPAQQPSTSINMSTTPAPSSTVMSIPQPASPAPLQSMAPQSTYDSTTPIYVPVPAIAPNGAGSLPVPDQTVGNGTIPGSPVSPITQGAPIVPPTTPTPNGVVNLPSPSPVSPSPVSPTGPVGVVPAAP